MRGIFKMSWLAIFWLTGIDVNAVDMIDLGVLPGGNSSFAVGVSNDGLVVVGGSNNTRAFRWTASGGMQDISNSNVGSNYAMGVSGDGTIVTGIGSFNNGSRSGSFRWDSINGMVDLGTVYTGLGNSANAISSDGHSIAGYTGTPSGYDHATLWTDTQGFQDLGKLSGSDSSRAEAISADGSVVVGNSWLSYSSTRYEGFVWTASAGMQSIGVLPGMSNSFAYGVSADGSVIVGASYTNAFRYTASGGMQDLGVINYGVGVPYSVATEVSGDGKVVVGYSGTTGVDEAFVWQESTGQMRTLSDLLSESGKASSWSNLASVQGVSGDSVSGYNLVGYGTISGQQHAFLVTGLFAVPEPSAFYLGAIAAMLFCSVIFTRNRDTNHSIYKDKIGL
jgi:probable HAF family extracellular repeat protein